MTATEVDNESFKMAETNVNTNNLQHLIAVKLVEGSKLLTDVLEEGKNYTFSMCNPPFFSSEDDLDFTSKSRSPSRPPPRNGTTGDLKELVAPGGEVAFILKMMKESQEFGHKIKIYTTMFGHKTSLAVLKLELMKLNVASMTETRFCQGNTTRWGLAWTYDKSFSLQKAYQTPNQKKSNIPMTYVVPPEVVNDATMYTVEIISERIMELLAELQVEHKLRKKNKFMTMVEVTAFKNTWSHQRRKKRKVDQIQDLKNCAGHCSLMNIEEKYVNENKFEEHYVNVKRGPEDLEHDQPNTKKMKEEYSENSICALDNNSPDSNANKHKCNNDNIVPLDPKSSVPEHAYIKTVPTPLLETIIFVRSIASEIHVEFLWRGGTGGRETMHQVLQYVKNKLK